MESSANNSLPIQVAISTASNLRPPIRVDQGKIYFLFIYDVGREINLEEAFKILSLSEKVAPEAIQPRHVGSKMFQRTTGLPVSWRGNVRDFEICGFKTSPQARFVLWPNGYVGIEFAIDLGLRKHKVKLEQIAALLHSMHMDTVLQSESMNLTRDIMNRVSRCISDSHDPSFCEDYVSVDIAKFDQDISADSLLKRKGHVLAHILRQEAYSREKTKLSKAEIAEVLDQFRSYKSDELVGITYEAAFLYGENVDDERRLVELLNVQMIEIRTLLKTLGERREEFNKRHLEILEEESQSFWESIRAKFRGPYIKKGRKWREFFTRKPALESMMQNIIELKDRAEYVLSAVLSPLEVTQDPFLSSVCKTANQAFELEGMIAQVETQLESLTTTYESLIEIKRHRKGEYLEKIVIILILIEVIPTVLNWTMNIIKLSKWSWILETKVMEALKSIFQH